MVLGQKKTQTMTFEASDIVNQNSL